MILFINDLGSKAARSALPRLALGSLLALGSVWASAQTLLTVNGHPITLEQTEAVNPQAAGNAEVRQQVLEQLAQQQLLADSVKEVPSATQTRIETGQANMRRQALAQLAADQYLKAHPLDEKAVLQAYDKVLATLPTTQYWVRWMVVNTPDEAKAALDDLRKGRSFVALTIAQSKGQNAELGGALGWQNEQTLPAAVLGVVRKLKIGEVAGPIALDSGYGIVQLVAQRNTPKPTLDALRPQLEQELRNAQLQAHIQELAKKAKIVNTAAPQTQGASAAPTEEGGNHVGKP